MVGKLFVQVITICPAAPLPPKFAAASLPPPPPPPGLVPLTPLAKLEPAPPAPPPGAAAVPPAPPPLTVPATPFEPPAVVIFPKQEAANPPSEGVARLLFTPPAPNVPSVPIALLAGDELAPVALNQDDVPAVAVDTEFAGAPAPPVPIL